jgi:hypothetical protein
MNLYQIENGKIVLRPHIAQDAALRSKVRFTFLVMGTQSGKTVLGPWWLYSQIYGNPVYGIEPRGDGDYLAATATYDLFKLKMLPELRTVFEQLTGCGRYWAGERVIELIDPATHKFHARRADEPMWGRLILRSAQSEGGLESATVKAAWLDECGQDSFRLDAWEAVQRRLSLSEGPVLGTTTPYNLGWLKTEVIDRWRSGDLDYHVTQAESVINPAFPRSEYERAQRTLADWKFKMFYQGLLTRPPGLIYGDFGDDLLVKSFPIPVSWPRYVGIDPGAIHTALIWIAEDTACGAFYIYRESLSGNMTTKEHIEAARNEARHERVMAWVGGSSSEKQFRMDWAADGLLVLEPAISDVEAGIDRVIELFKSKCLFVFENCRGLRDELGTYSREMGDDGQPTEKIKNKQDFHRLDALRYVVVYLFHGSKDVISEVVELPWQQIGPDF